MNRPEFRVHRLNEAGIEKAQILAARFDMLLNEIEALAMSDQGLPARLAAIVRTKLEEACFFAKKMLAENPENQVTP